MSDEETERARVAKAKTAHEEWSAKFPEVSRALRDLGPSPTPNALAEWERKYPAAVPGQVRLTLYSSEVLRKMRLHDPTWEPPD